MPPYGQAIKDNFLLIRENPITGTPLTFNDASTECCLTLPVFAEVSPSNDLFNDQSSPIFFWGAGFSTANLILQKYENGAWIDKETLNVSTWGTAYAYGFFTNMNNEKAIGYNLQWKLVLNDIDLGEGNYRFKSVGTILIGGGTVTKYSFEYCLKTYTAYRADDTIRVDWWMSGNFGDVNDDRLKSDYGDLNWFNQMRLPGAVFGFDTSTTEQTYVKYQNGKQVWLTDSQVEEYQLKMGRYDQELHKFIKVQIMQADEIRITDYSINNPTRHQNKYVRMTGDYSPNWVMGSMTALVEVKMQQAYQNFNHKRS